MHVGVTVDADLDAGQSSVLDRRAYFTQYQVYSNEMITEPEHCMMIHVRVLSLDCRLLASLYH